jgi:hypothetical protein
MSGNSDSALRLAHQAQLEIKKKKCRPVQHWPAFPAAVLLQA